MPKDPPAHPSKSLTTVNYRSTPVWSSGAAFAGFFIFFGLFSYLVGAPTVAHLVKMREHPAVIRPTESHQHGQPYAIDPDLSAPANLFDPSLEDLATTPINLGLENFSLWINKQLGNEIHVPPVIPYSEPGMRNDHFYPVFSAHATPRQFQQIDSAFRLQLREQEKERHYTSLSRAIFAESLLLVLAGMSLLLALRLKERKLQLGTDGLHFPSGMMAQLNWRRKRTWDDLSAIALGGTGTLAEPHKMEFYFKSGGEASILTDRLSNAELQKFFLALDEHAEHAMRSPALLAYRHEILNAAKQNDPSFTQLWEEEMSSHFSATNFCALAADAKLQNGKVRIIMHMSSGGLSAVYLAERNKQMIVIKESVVPPGSSQSNREKARDMFAREASMLMKLDHPQIAKVLDNFQENDRDYLMLEYIPGVTLREYVRRHGPQLELRVSDWAKQIAAILQYLHEQDPPVIHRDLTPDNLMITPSGKIVLIDFGAANQFLGTATGTIVGKQYYISPEQFRGKAEPASDIYSLGGTLHYLLTGIEPEALSVSHPKKLLQSLTYEIDSLVASCTALNPEQRIRSAAAFLAALSNPAGTSVETVIVRTNEAVSKKHTEPEGVEGLSISIKQEEKQLQ